MEGVLKYKLGAAVRTPPNGQIFIQSASARKCAISYEDMEEVQKWKVRAADLPRRSLGDTFWHV